MIETPRVHRRATTLALAVLLLLVAGACSDGGDDGERGGATTTTTPGRSGEITVLTYNVAGLPQEISDVNPEEHIPLISPLLDAYDLVLTQEDFDWWQGDLVSGLDFVNYHDRLRSQTTHEYATPRHPGPEAAGLDVATRPDLNAGDGIGILARFPLDDFRAQAWKGCFGGFDTTDGGAGDCLAMKGFRVATMDLEGAEVDVYSLHVEAGGTEEDQRLQAEDVEQLTAFVLEHSEGRAVILGGDTNLHTAERGQAESDHADGSGDADTRLWQDFLERTGLTDACDATECPDAGSIDKVAYRSSDAITLEATSHEMPREEFTDPAGEDLSDHPPVVVTLRWTVPR